MPLKRAGSRGSLLVLPLLIAVSAPACAPRAPSATTPSPPAPSLAPRLVPPPPAGRNLIRNGGFEEVRGETPAGWSVSGSRHPGARLRSVASPGAPEGNRVAEITLSRDAEASYGIHLEQRHRLEYQTTYDLSVWVRGIDLVSEVRHPHGFGRECGLFFWIYGPAGDRASRVFPSGAYPAADGTTSWALRTMRFTTPPAEAFGAAASSGGDTRLHLQLLVQLYGTGTIQVDDVRLARSEAAPPPAKRTRGELAFARRGGKPFFALGLYRRPTGMTWRQLAGEATFNLVGGAEAMAEKRALGFSSMVLPLLADPACTGCDTPGAELCAFCRLCPDDQQRCGSYAPRYLSDPGGIIWVDEPNGAPEIQGDLEDLVASARRIRLEGERLRPQGEPVQIFASDMPGGVYFNTYGWDDLVEYHRSEAFDIVSVIRRGGNPRPGSLGGVMSMYPQTGTNGIRNEARRLSDDVTDPAGRQSKPVWMLVNGGSGRIVRERGDPRYKTAPHDAPELLAMRPSLAQLRYMLYASLANGVTGFLFYQDDEDTLLTPKDPYWTGVLLPAAAELATLEKETQALSRAEVNTLRYRLTGDADGVDSILKQIGESWILIVANSSPDALKGVEFVLEQPARMAPGVERIDYRHDREAARRRFRASPAERSGDDRLGLDLPGYGVGIYRFRVSGPAGTTPAAPGSD